MPITGNAREICLWKYREALSSTTKVEDVCGECVLHKQLFCQPTIRYRLIFGLSSALGFISAIIGVFLTSFPLWARIGILAFYFGYLIFFLNFWESRMLCNHCPYYANDSERVLNCPIDKGKLKTGTYNPGPTTRSEKNQFRVGVVLFILLMIPFHILGDQLLWAGITVLGFLMWLILTQKYVCTHCINFGCPFNKVSKKIRDAFLRKNPIICKAWEKTGYQLGTKEANRITESKAKTQDK